MEFIKNENLPNYTLIKGNIYTADINNKFVESLLLEGNKIVCIGSNENCKIYIEMNNLNSEEIRVINLGQNQLALPGFIDSHMHPLLGGLSEEAVNISDCTTPLEIIEKIKAYISINKDKKFIIGIGYNDSIFTEEMPIHYSILDKVSTEIPIVVMRFDAHAYWCNSAILKLAGINKDTITPEGGRIQKNGDGEVEGILHDGAMTLVKKIMPKLAEDKKLAVLTSVLKYLMSLGITGFMDAAVKYKNFEIYKKLYLDQENSSNLPRCALSIVVGRTFVDSEKDDTDEEKEGILTIEDNINKMDNFFNKNRIKDWFNNKFKVNTVKLFIDGVFESGTALFRKCNCGEDEEAAHYTYTPEQLQKLFDYLYSNDFQIHTHCIGDLASKIVIDTLENSKTNFSQIINNQRNYIAHLQVVSLEDIKRMKELNIYGNFSPYWFSEDNFSKIVEKMLGEDRKNDIYPIKTMIENGVKVGFGSDWPVSTPVPLKGIEVAITHRGLALSPDKPSYNEKQIISIFDAVKAYTIGSAEIMGLNDVVGSLEVGKLGDIVILDKNIFEIPPWKIHTTNVDVTILDGRIVYEKNKTYK